MKQLNVRTEYSTTELSLFEELQKAKKDFYTIPSGSNYYHIQKGIIRGIERSIYLLGLSEILNDYLIYLYLTNKMEQLTKDEIQWIKCELFERL